MLSLSDLKMKSFVISLINAHDRRKHIHDEFLSKNVSFEFFDAIEPHTLKNTERELVISLDNSDLSDNEKSCFMSHFSVWNKAVKYDLSYIAVFEDDIYLSQSSSVLLNTDTWINVDFLKIEKTTESVLLKNKAYKEFKDEKFIVGELNSSHMGAGGYILSLKAVKSLIAFVKAQETLDHVDQIIFDWYRNEGEYKVFQLNPVICIQDCILHPENQKFQTSLQWRDKKKEKMVWWKKIYREIKRIFVKALEAPYKVTLIFRK